MKKKKINEAPEPKEGGQEYVPLTGKERLKEIGSGLAWLLPGIASFIYGVYGLCTNNVYLLLPGRGGGRNFLHGPEAWVHSLFYLSLSFLLYTLAMDYLSNEEEHPRRDKVFTVSWKLTILFYVLTFIMINLWGLSGDLLSVRRIRVFGVWFVPHGPALWNLYLFFVCMTVVIMSFIEPWPERFNALAGKVVKVAWVLLGVTLVASMIFILLGIGMKGVKDDTGLFKSVKNNDLKSVKVLLSAGADINAVLDSGTNSEWGTALAIAAAKGYKDMAQLLLENKADVNKRSKTGWAPLQAAAFNLRDSRNDIGCHDDMVLLLIKNGAKVNGSNKDGLTALMGAALSGCSGVVKDLVENKADINARDGARHTALLHAVKAVRYTSEYDPMKQHKVNVVDKEGYDLLNYLLEHGADPNVRNDWAETPLSVARKKKLSEVVELLEKYHAKE